jgi:hypothetical protein
VRMSSSRGRSPGDVAAMASDGVAPPDLAGLAAVMLAAAGAERDSTLCQQMSRPCWWNAMVPAAKS